MARAKGKRSSTRLTRLQQNVTTSNANANHVSSTTNEDGGMHLKNLLKEIEKRERDLEQTTRRELERLDRALQLQLATMTAKELNQIPGGEAAASGARNQRKKSSLPFTLGLPLSSSTGTKSRPLVEEDGGGSQRQSRSCTKRTAIASATVTKSRPLVEEDGPGPAATGSQRQSRSRTKRTAIVSATVTKSRPIAEEEEEEEGGSVRPLRRAPSTRDNSMASTADKRRVEGRSRTPSCSRAGDHSTISYQTPLMKRNCTMTPAITPKVDPYGPIPLRRQPRGGELAISVDGSPLMTHPGHSEPNITVPVNDEVYCIMPSEGPFPSISNIDEETKDKLRKLRENLNSILDR